MAPKFLTSEDLIPFLKDNGIDFECVKHEPVFTVDAMKQEMNKMPGLHFKNLFLRERKTDGYYLLVTLHDRELNLNAISKALGLTNKSGLRFASEDQLMEKLGVRQGSVSLLSVTNDTDRCVTILLDSAVMEQDDHLRWFHLMQNDVSAGLSRAALRKFFDLIEARSTFLLSFDPDGSIAVDLLQKMAKVNATIKRMTVAQVREELSTLRLDTGGNKVTLVKRLKSYYQHQRLQTLNRAPRKNIAPDRYYDYLLVVDFECTCEENVDEYNHEIIEFPVVMVSTKQMRIVDEFHAYVKPLMHAQLSDFCSRLTGISQAQVDAARPFPGVFDDFRAWMSERNLTDGGHRFAFVTDGPWDLANFFQMQCYHSGYDTVPHDFRYWINVRRAFTNLMDKQGQKGMHRWKNLTGMLSALGMTFEGRQHSGIDDARNISRIVIGMLQKGCDLHVNERLMRRDIADKKLEERRHEPNDKPRPPRGVDAAFVPSHTEPRAISPERPTQSQEDKERREYLPYKVVTISKSEFQLDQYEECETCDEAADDSDEEE